MKRVITAKDAEEILRNGGSVPGDAVLTPSARDLFRGKQVSFTTHASSAVTNVDRFFRSAEIQKLKEDICDVGRRLWQRAYVDGNGGNIAVRVADNIALCTPTMISKGFMKPEDMCLVDWDGNQLAGKRKVTSEIFLHLQILKAQPKAKATVHCHPPYARGFAVAGVTPPTCLLPEIEIFVGEVPIAPYLTPGTKEMGAEVAKLADHHNTILLANHGAVSWSHNVEDAYFKMEILEAHCRSVLVSAQLGKPPNAFSPTQLKDLLNIKQKLDIPDRRIGLKECELCDNTEWRPGVTCSATTDDGSKNSGDSEAEQLVQTVTDLIMEKIKG